LRKSLGIVSEMGSSSIVFGSFTPIHSMDGSCAKRESWLWLPMEEGVALDRGLWREGIR